MNPRNVLHMQESLLGLLAGDLFRSTSLYWGLRAFKSLYYITNVIYFRRCLSALLRRKRSIREIYTEPPPADARA